MVRHSALPWCFPLYLQAHVCMHLHLLFLLSIYKQISWATEILIIRFLLIVWLSLIRDKTSSLELAKWDSHKDLVSNANQLILSFKIIIIMTSLDNWYGCFLYCKRVLADFTNFHFSYSRDRTIYFTIKYQIH